MVKSLKWPIVVQHVALVKLGCLSLACGVVMFFSLFGV